MLKTLQETIQIIKRLPHRKQFEFLNDLLIKHDLNTYIHSADVALLAKNIGILEGFTKKDIETLYYTAFFHDIGKIFIPQEVLNKAEQLLPGDWEMIQFHPVAGFHLLKSLSDGFLINPQAVLHHHENVNGTGYPIGLTGEKLDSHTKIIRIIDSLVAMMEKRCYQHSFSCKAALGDLLRYEDVFYDKWWLDRIVSHIEHNRSIIDMMNLRCHEQRTSTYQKKGEAAVY